MTENQATPTVAQQVIAAVALRLALGDPDGIFSLEDVQENLPVYVSYCELVLCLADTPYLTCMSYPDLRYWRHTLVRLAHE